MDELIRKQDALDVTMETVFVEYEDGDPRKEESIILQTKAAIRDRIKALPPVQPEILASGEGELNVPDTNVGDMISRQAAIYELSQRYIIMDNPHYIGYNAGLDEAQKVIKALPIVQPTITHEQAIDYLHKTGWLQNHDRILTESKIVPPIQLETPNNQTHLCVGCNYVYPECPTTEADVVFGNGTGNDNICMCACFKPKEPKHGEWEYHSNPTIGINPETAYCSCCGFRVDTTGNIDFDEYDFCPHCGADMRGNTNV